MNEKLSELCKGVTINAEHGARLDWEKQDEWQQRANGWRVTLGYQGRTYSLDFWQGTGIKDEPDAAGVLECLLSDASSADQDFEGWCSDLGENTDSRKAHATWRACQRIALRLRRLLGDDFERFMMAER
jgi:hypothetical protein